MDTETRSQVRTGRCPQDGTVRAVREMPKPQWPFFLYLWKRATANRAPFTCPECGQPVTDVEKS
jgi:hypothetical protein